MAGNQLGKCRTYDDLVLHPDGKSSKIGDLFNAGLPFDVLSFYDGACHPARASHVIKKPAQECVRLYLSNGLSFGASIGHAVLTACGWQKVQYLLSSALVLRPSSSERDRSARVVNEGRWIEKALGLTTDCFAGFRQYGERLRYGEVAALALETSGGDVPQHNRALLPLDYLEYTDTNNSQPSRAPLSNLCEVPHREAPTFASLGRDACRPSQLLKGKHQELLRLWPELEGQLLSSGEGDLRESESGDQSLVSPEGEYVRVLAYMPIGVHDLYDMSVPFYENYCVDGIIHHNTYSGAAELAFHLTGRYPDDWIGKRYDRPTRWWAASKTNEVTRDGVQRLLIGEPKDESQWGTGFIPHSCLKDWSRRQGVADALDSAVVLHEPTGLMSTLGFKSYDQGRQKFQGETLDGVWLDEEPPADIYTECLTRTNATGGIVYLTFTPLLGMSAVVSAYLGVGQEQSQDRHVTTMTIEDAEHYSPEQRQQIINSYPEHEREARTQGVPIMGSGRVFPIAESEIKVDPFIIPDHWALIGGVDFGWDHPFGATCLAWDRDSDIIYVTREYGQREVTPVIHCAAIKPWGAWIPFAWPHDGLQHDKGSGEALKDQYAAQGLNMLPERATFDDGGNGVEAGVIDMFTRMQTGRWKVFSTCTKWFEEFRLYHRKDGMIVKERDDVISSSRYAYMMRRFAQTGSVGKIDVSAFLRRY